MAVPKIEQISEGVTQDCGVLPCHTTLNGNCPCFSSRKWTALQGRHSNSRSSTPRFKRATSRWNPPVMDRCSFPPPPCLWLISSSSGRSQPHRTHTIFPLPTSRSARRRYLRSQSRQYPCGRGQDFSLSIFGLNFRSWTERAFPQLGQRSWPNPVAGFHVQSHSLHDTTALMGVFPHGRRLGVSARSFSIRGAHRAR